MIRLAMTGLIAAAFAAPLAVAGGPLESSLETFVIEKSADGQEMRKKVDDIPSGETIEYVLTYENVSDEELLGLIVSAPPLPAEATFVIDSASSDTEAVFEVSADNGENWGPPPLMRTTGAGDEIIPASEYNLLRWVINGALEGEGQWQFSYRIAAE